VAFRAFQIAPALRERYGYPEITPALRARVFGLNGARVYNISADEIRLRSANDRIQRRQGTVQGRSGPAVSHLRSEDAARVPEPALLEGRQARRLTARRSSAPIVTLVTVSPGAYLRY
jgi:hypothetical protein